MTPAERLAEAQSAEAALERYLRPAFEVVEREYAEKLIALAGETTGQEAKIARLSLAIKVARTVRTQIEALAADGAAAGTEMERLRQIEKIPEHKRGILGL